MTKPRVLFLNHNFKGEGTYLRCFNLGRELARKGFAIDIVCASREEYDLTISTETVEEDFRVITLPRLTQKAAYIGYAIRSLLAIPRTLFGRYDLIHAFAVAIPSTAFPAILAGRLRKIPLVVDWDDVWAGGLAGFAAPTAAHIVKYLEHETPRLARAHGITVVSEFLRERAESLYKKTPVHKVLNGADVASIHPVEKSEARKEAGIPEGELVLMSMGRTYTRSFEILLATFEKVLAQRPDARLYMVGQICEYGLLKEYVSQTKKRFTALLDKIVFTGPVQYDRLKYHLSSADVLLLPMEDCPHDKARFPIRFGDYIASGNAIVSNAVGEIKLLLEQYRAGVTAHPNNTTEFAQKILDTIAMKNQTEDTPKNARDLAQGDLLWASVTERLVEVYAKYGLTPSK